MDYNKHFIGPLQFNICALTEYLQVTAITTLHKPITVIEYSKQYTSFHMELT